MIFKALEYIRIKLNDFLQESISTINDGDIVLDNIAQMEDNEFQGKNKVVISLVNIEEESALKNQKSYRITNGSNKTVEYERPAIRLNLYVLFSANFNSYDISLTALSKIIEFFQGQKCFNFKTDPVDPSIVEGKGFMDADKDTLDLKLDLYTMTFEQLNHLWGALGGKQVPSTLFKLRLVEIKADKIRSTSGVIERIRTDENAL